MRTTVAAALALIVGRAGRRPPSARRRPCDQIAATSRPLPVGLLAELTRAHLLTEPAPGRFIFHDLLRAYARELAEGHDSAGDRAAAEGRIIEHYRHAAQHAAALLEPYVAPIALEPPPADVAAEDLATAADALRWFVTEDAALTGCVRLAAGHRSRAWQLAWNMTAFHMRRGWHADHETTQRTALDAARAAGDAGGEAHVLLSLALGFNRSGRHDAAEDLFGQVLPFFEEAGDLGRQATIHQGLAFSGRPATASTRPLCCSGSVTRSRALATGGRPCGPTRTRCRSSRILGIPTRTAPAPG
jgi:hypothetical protein